MQSMQAFVPSFVLAKDCTAFPPVRPVRVVCCAANCCTPVAYLWIWARRARCAPPPVPEIDPPISRAVSWANRLETAAPHTAPDRQSHSGPVHVGSAPHSRSWRWGKCTAQGRETPSISSAKRERDERGKARALVKCQRYGKQNCVLSQASADYAQNWNNNTHNTKLISGTSAFELCNFS